MIDRRAIGKESKTLKRIKGIKNFLNIIICIVIVPILIVNFTMIIKKLMNPKETPDFLGYRFFIILTGSMEDTLNMGDFIVVKEVPEENLKEQDIITFNLEETTITHRISKIENKNGQKLFVTKGDNNNTEDADRVKISDIEGRYVFKISVLGTLLIFLQKPIGIAILIIIPIIIGLISFRINSYIHQKKIIRKTKRLKYDGEKNEKEN